MNFVKITGIIAEYNPFHNGHKYQIEKAREKCDAIVVIMSGSFVQRGEIAITDKWTRAKEALKNGADLVIELPVIYSLNTAQKFAKGAVRILNRTGVVNTLCFGSENGDINKLKNAGRLLYDEPLEVSEKIKKYVSEGMSYAAARTKAYEGYIDADILSNPNNILAVEYIKALIETESNIEPFTIKRCGTGYNDMHTSGDIASATAIRNMAFNNEDFGKYTTSVDFEIYNKNGLDSAVIAYLRTIDKASLALINDVGEGLENRIKDAAMKCTSVDELCDMVTTKRYPRSRIQRIVFSSLLGLTKEICEKECNYLRVLGMNDIGKEILRDIKRKSQLNIITKTADYKCEDEVFKKDILATDLFALCAQKAAGMDYVNSPVIL